MNISFSFEEIYYWEYIRPLVHFLKRQGHSILFVTLKKNKSHPFLTALREQGIEIMFVKKNAVSFKVERLDCHFVANYLYAEDVPNVVISHGQSIKMLDSEINMAFPQTKVAASRFRYDSYLVRKKYGVLHYMNRGIRLPEQYLDSDDVDFFLLGNILKMDNLLFQDVEPFVWDSDKTKVLFAVTCSAFYDASLVEQINKIPSVSLAVKPHYFSGRKHDFSKIKNLKLVQGELLPAMQSADVVVSDKSSVLYEAALLNKKVIRLNDNDLEPKLTTGARSRFRVFRDAQYINLAEAKYHEALWNVMSSGQLLSLQDFSLLKAPCPTLLNEQFPYRELGASERLWEYVCQKFKL